MTFGKAAVAVVALVAAFALGMWTGPYLTDRDTPAATETVAAEPTTSPRAAVRKRAGVSREARETRETREAEMAAIPASAPEVHKHLKPLLNPGTKMEIASEGFRDAAQFAAVAHAARNTQVPFMVLKHRVLNEGKTLAAAIKESKPDIDAAAEARRAREAAQKDVAALRTMPSSSITE